MTWHTPVTSFDIPMAICWGKNEPTNPLSLTASPLTQTIIRWKLELSLPFERSNSGRSQEGSLRETGGWTMSSSFGTNWFGAGGVDSEHGDNGKGASQPRAGFALRDVSQKQGHISCKWGSCDLHACEAQGVGRLEGTNPLGRVFCCV